VTAAALHVPVLLDEVIAGLAPQPGERHVDGTFGAGGTAARCWQAGAEVIAFDQDPDAIEAGAALASEARAG
jgi:16S rRNA (cytosine1402-N4)-methyltransferase